MDAKDTSKDRSQFRRPNESCLERFRVEIADKRMLGWSYRAIRRWLRDEHRYEMHWGTVRKFCLVRKIEKHVGETVGVVAAPATSQPDYFAVPENPLVRRRQHTGKVFDYDDSGPLITRRTKPDTVSGDGNVIPHKHLNHRLVGSQSRPTVHFINEADIPIGIWTEAYRLCRGVDEKDTPKVAITMHFDGLLWTLDEELKQGIRARGFGRIFIPS